MNCFLPLIYGVCLASSSELRIEADIRFQVSDPVMHWMDYRPYRGGVGNLAALMQVRVSDALSFDYGFGHQSFTGTSRDRGYEYATARLTWRPFGERL